MGSWRKVGAFLGLVPEDQQYAGHDGYEGSFPEGYGDEYDREPAGEYGPEYGRDHAGAGPRSDYQRPGYGPAAERTSVAGGRKSFGVEQVTQGALAMKSEPVVQFDSTAASRPATVKLNGFAEARLIGEKYRDGQSVILDMTQMSDSDARRLVDFSAGLAFSLRGSIEKVAPKVFMLLPPDSDVSAVAAYQDAHAYVGR